MRRTASAQIRALTQLEIRKDATVMVSTDLGACEWFVWDLRRSNLLDRGQLDQIVGEFLEKNPRAEPPALAEFLVQREILTQFQADRLLQGKTQGFVLGPYVLMDALGTGSMGTVYKAQSKNDSLWYAVKVLPRRSMWNVRLARRKVRAFEQCQHPAVVPFVDVGTSGGMHYLAWPMVEGETLDKVVQREAKLNPELAAQFALQIAEGLDVCHRENLFHGLLKPSNLMVCGNNQVRILDFGIGSLLAETEGESLVDTMSTANSVASGLDCTSPESVMDPTNLTPTGDQYSLGCVLYFCLSGRYPFPSGTAAEKMMAHQFKQPDPIRELVPDLPEPLAVVVERLMQKVPECRYPNTAEVIEALRPIAGVAASTANQVDKPAHRQPGEPLVRPRPKPFPVNGPAAVASNPAPDKQAYPRKPAADIPTRGSFRVPASGADKAAAVAEGTREVSLTPVPSARVVVPEKVDNPVAVVPEAGYSHTEARLSLEERLGPAGMAIAAVLLSVLAWLVTWKWF
jgi:serine/threonine-protein kinase